jgi:hypothetical protein
MKFMVDGVTDNVGAELVRQCLRRNNTALVLACETEARYREGL